MAKFTEWLKFYFVGFFTHGLSKESGDRSFFNTLLSFVLAFVIVCCGLIAGYSASFGVQYDNSKEFKTFLYAAFVDENSSDRIDLSVKGGYLSADIDGSERINTLLNEGNKYIANGYQLIVDTRPADTTYAEFIVKCKKSDNTEIDYGAYRNLSDDDKKSYTLTVDYSGLSLNPSEKLAEYETYLSNTESVAEAYGKLKADFAGGTISAEQYSNGVYELYFNTYFVGLPKDSYGKAPTLRTYYLSPSTYENTDKYFALFDNVCFCAFKTDKGIAVEFSGYFNKLDDGKINGDSLTVEQMQTNVDGMIKESFASASGLNFLVYIISLGRSVAVFVMAIILLALIVFIVLKVRKVEFCPRYTETIKIVGSFQLWSAIITFISTFICSFFLARGSVFVAAEIIFLCVMAVRTAIYLIIEVLSDKKKKDGIIEKQD